ncbi:hypothetical protein RIF29_41691 [Crotalaria pallida]|uniref:Uncharacterized protein n=1 Tax=Crotalaria pallida TaxID=3830 RepID=A0AAN9E6W0_CROPI
MSYSGGGRGYGGKGYGYTRPHDRDWEKDFDNFFDGSKLFLHQHNRNLPGYPHSGSTNRFERHQIQHLKPMTGEKRWVPRSATGRTTASDLSNTQRNSDKRDLMVKEANNVDIKHKTWFETQYPLPGVEVKHGGLQSGRASSSDSSAASPEILATKILDQHTTVSASSSLIVPSTVGLSMAETVARGPPRSDKDIQEQIIAEKREELALRQSKALIPLIPSKPRNLVDGPKFKAWKPNYQGYSHPTTTLSPHGGTNAKSDLQKKAHSYSHVAIASGSKGVSLVKKDILSPHGRNTRNNSSCAVKTSEKASQTKSRIAFFKNLSMKSSLKKSSSDNPCSTDMSCTSERSEVVTVNSLDRAPSMETTTAVNSLAILWPEEKKEIEFMRSLGWEENLGNDDEGLTEEEIRDFFEKVEFQIHPLLGS